jgi:hypothetical protein
VKAVIGWAISKLSKGGLYEWEIVIERQLSHFTGPK